MKLLLGLFLVVYCFKIQAQKLDSLYLLYHDKSYFDGLSADDQCVLYGKIIDHEINLNPELSLRQIDTLAPICRRAHGEKAYNRIKYKKKGFAYYLQDNYVEALNYYEQYAQIFDKEGVDDAYFLVDIGNIYYRLGLHQIAKKYYRQAEGLFQKATRTREENAYKGLATVYGNYSLLADKGGENDTAFYYAFEALKIQQKEVKDLFQLSYYYFMLGHLYAGKKEDYAVAVTYYEKCIAAIGVDSLKERRQYEQFAYLLPLAYIRMGRNQCAMGQLDTGWYYIEKGVAMAHQANQLASFLYAGIEAAEEYIAQERYEVAEALLDTCLKVATSTNHQTILGRTLYQLTKLHAAKKEYNAAFKYSQQHSALKDSVAKRQDDMMVVNELVLQQENKRMIAQQQQTIVVEQSLTNRLYIILVLAVILLIVLFVFGWQFRQKNRTIKKYLQELEESDATKEVMLSVIGHDLRSPFGVLMGNAAQLLHHSVDTPHFQQTQQVYKASKQAYTMMENLMQWVTLQKEQRVIHQQNVDLNTLLKETLQELELLLEVNEVGIDLEQFALFQVQTDRILLQIILRNILTNAIKHSPLQGTIKIHTTWIEEELCLLIQDEGDGISKELLKQLMEDKSAVEVAQKGHGLGLSIVRQLSKQLSIAFKLHNNTKSSGATVALRFPKGKAALLATEKVSLNNTPAMVASTVLSWEEKQLLEPYTQVLKQYEVFEGSAINKVLVELETSLTRSAAMAYWLQKLRQSINAAEEDAYQALLIL